MTAASPAPGSALLQTHGLIVELGTEEGWVRPVDSVSLRVGAGEILGLVGESGCGKSMTALAVMRLLPEPGSRTVGQVLLNDRELLGLREREMQRVRGRLMSMVFQEPMTSLDPVFTVRQQLTETIRAHRDVSKHEANELAEAILDRVGIPDPHKRIGDYPHQLSGGMRQRVMIAIALVLEPRLLIADEPTTALDVTIQAQILELIDELRVRSGMGVLLISHDLAVVAQVAERVAVMYAGELVEVVPTATLFTEPRHPYTQGLLRCIPGLASNDTEGGRYLHVIDGRVPELRNLPPACRFAPRCPFAVEQCWTERPQLENVADDHYLRCWNPQPYRA